MHYITLIIIALLLYCGCGIGRIFNDSVETFDTTSFEPEKLNKVRMTKYSKFQRQLDKDFKQYIDRRDCEVKGIIEDSDEFDYNKSHISDLTIPFFDGNPFYDSGPSQKLELGLSSLNNGALVKYKRKKYLNPYNFRNYNNSYPPRKSWSKPSKLNYNKLYF